MTFMLQSLWYIFKGSQNKYRNLSQFCFTLFLKDFGGIQFLF